MNVNSLQHCVAGRILINNLITANIYLNQTVDTIWRQ